MHGGVETIVNVQCEPEVFMRGTWKDLADGKCDGMKLSICYRCNPDAKQIIYTCHEICHYAVAFILRRITKEIVLKDHRVYLHCFINTTAFDLCLLEYFPNFHIGVMGIICHAVMQADVGQGQHMGCSAGVGVAKEGIRYLRAVRDRWKAQAVTRILRWVQRLVVLVENIVYSIALREDLPHLVAMVIDLLSWSVQAQYHYFVIPFNASCAAHPSSGLGSATPYDGPPLHNLSSLQLLFHAN
ncbi:uncharacterized protein EV420DRAFT_1489116 [Desarmillaria tabescens]|uniref:Uncharacterized protein n=1 Tax=Armillaria tabescens TaxID=1929756 RepID=A0AA39MH31_ARMTA|nr:uncharacterized protein EV420DRAFT_1489116 [Desarmillaria tabescens]KAK0433489.1 hypothetical protein EV420DRAFT_1489116 [Desarmillaria tabescens]